MRWTLTLASIAVALVCAPASAQRSRGDRAQVAQVDIPPDDADMEEEDYGEEEAAPAPRRAPAASGGRMQRLLAILRAEPDIRTIQREALHYYDLEPSRVAGLVEAAHLKGLIPALEGSYNASLGTNYEAQRDGLYPILPSPPNNPNPFSYRTRTQGENASNTFYVRAVFALDRLAFNPEGLDARSLNGLGENLMREVTSLYYSRHRLIASLLLDPPQSELEVFQELMRLDEMTSTLDGLTGGHFTERAWHWDDSILEGGGPQ